VLINDCRQIFNDCYILPLEVREDGRLVGGKGYITERNGRSS